MRNYLKAFFWVTGVLAAFFGTLYGFVTGVLFVIGHIFPDLPKENAIEIASFLYIVVVAIICLGKILNTTEIDDRKER